MKVLHLLNELKPSGAEIMLRIAAPFFRANGVECEILSTGPQPGPYAALLEAAGYRIHHIPFSKNPVFFFKVAQLVRRTGAELVHLHTERAFMAYVLALKAFTRCQLVRTVHNNFQFEGFLRQRRSWERQLAERWGLRYIAIAPGVMENEQQRFGTHPELIPNWFDSARFSVPTEQERATARQALQLPPGVPVLVSIGNCSPVKNHTALIEALAQCQDLPWHYLHLGMEEPGEPERAMAARLGLADRISFYGAVNDVRPYLHAADLYTMPSRFEGMSIAALEAQATGLRALLADVPGLKDFRHYLGEVSYCAPDAGPIASSLRALLGQAQHADPAGAQARSAAIHAAFGAERGVKAYSDLYRKLLGRPGASQRSAQQGQPT